MAKQRQMEAGFIRGMIEAIAEVAGVKGRNLVLRHAGLEEYIDNPPPMSETELVPAEQYQAIENALMQAFGTKASRIVLIYAGEATIRRAVESLPGLFSSAVRFIPGRLRKQAVFRIAIKQIGKSSGIAPRVDFQEDRIVLSNAGCRTCEGYQSDEPICFYTCGVLMALTEWATHKKPKVTEVQCKAVGDESCVFEISGV